MYKKDLIKGVIYCILISGILVILKALLKYGPVEASAYAVWLNQYYLGCKSKVF